MSGELDRIRHTLKAVIGTRDPGRDDALVCDGCAMQYNGGKTRIAKHIAPIVNRERAGRLCWEPFCGGLGMTEHLLPDVASDVHPGLIALYEKLRAEPDWLDGFECTEEIYQAAKSWPDDDPAKAFIGFGCAFGGKWFGGFARRQITAKNPHSVTHVSRSTLKRKIEKTSRVQFKNLSFFDVRPQPGWLIYCDPPYANTTLAGAAKGFDFDGFKRRCELWTKAGSIVYVSEYSFDIGVEVWSGSPQCSLGSGVKGGQSGVIGEGATERLFRLGL